MQATIEVTELVDRRIDRLQEINGQYAERIDELEAEVRRLRHENTKLTEEIEGMER